MDELQQTNTVSIAYNILWMYTSGGKSEPTEGRIEIESVPNEPENDTSPSADENTDDSADDDLMSFTTEDSEELSTNYDSSSYESESHTTSRNSRAALHSTHRIPCIATLTWGSWLATFYCTYHPTHSSFRSPAPGGFHNFSIRSMNEWMEMALLTGHTLIHSRIYCDKTDDHGHDLLKFEAAWDMPGGGIKISRLWAKRVTGDGDGALSEAECRRLGIIGDTRGERSSRGRGRGDGAGRRGNAGRAVMSGRGRESTGGTGGGEPRGRGRGRGGRHRGAGRGSIRGR